MRDEESVGRLLSRAFGVLIALFVAAGAIGLGIVLVQHRAMTEVSERVQPLELANEQLDSIMSAAQWAIRGYALTGDSKMLELFDQCRIDYPVASRTLRAQPTTGRDSRAVTEQLTRADAWWATANRQRVATPRGPRALAYAEQTQAQFQAFDIANDSLKADLAARGDRLQRRSMVLWYVTITAVVVIVGAATVVAVRTAVRTRRRIVGPLDEVISLLEGRQAGDRDARAAMHGPAEIRALAVAINGAADQADLVRQHGTQVAARLQALDTAKTDFMSTVSHELRTPLTSISGYLELLRDPEMGTLTDAQERMLEVIARNSRRLRELIEDILTLSRIETGEFRSELGVVDLAEVIDRAVVTIGPAAAKASVNLHCDVRGPLPARGDGSQLDRVLDNLLSNAVKFTPADGTVTIHAERQHDQVTVVVADTGMGIPVDERQALFARFFRATNAIRQAVPGTGLGLAIVRTIVDNHGGTIDVDSTEDVGTTVTIKLPAESEASTMS